MATVLSRVSDGFPSGIPVVQRFRHAVRSGITPLDNYGVSVVWEAMNDALTGENLDTRQLGAINAIMTDVSSATEDAFFEVRNVQAGSLGHADLRTKDTVVTGTKIFKINSRNYVNTSGDAVGLEVGPRATVTTTGEVRAIHAKPNLSDTFNAGSLTGVFAEVWARGTGAGTVTTARAFYGKVLDDSDGAGTGTKTYTNPVAILWAEANIGTGNTFSGKMFVINAEKGAYYDWDGLVRFSATGAAGKSVFLGAAAMFKDPTVDAEAGYISVYVGSTRYEVPIYAVS